MGMPRATDWRQPNFIGPRITISLAYTLAITSPQNGPTRPTTPRETSGWINTMFKSTISSGLLSLTAPIQVAVIFKATMRFQRVDLLQFAQHSEVRTVVDTLADRMH